MKDQGKTKENLTNELVSMRQRIAELEASLATLKQREEPRATTKAMIEAFDGLIYVCSPTYEVEFMNERFIERTGYNPIGEKCYQALHDRNEICPWCVSERVQLGETVRWEIQSPKDNRWYYVVNTPVRHRDGTISKMAMIQDVTERKQAEEALRKAKDELERRVEERTAELKTINEELLREIAERKAAEEVIRESEERFRNVFEQGPLGIAIVDLDYRWVAVNATLCQMVGYTEDELTKLTFVDITHPDDIEADVGYAEKLERGEIPSYKMEKRYIKKNGEILWIHLAASIVHDDQGKALYYLSMIKDISDRKRTEDALYESELMLRTILATSPVGIALTKKRRIEWANEVCKEMFGFEDEHEYLGQDARMIYFSGEEYDRAGKVLYQDIETGTVGETDTKFRRKDGSVFDAHVKMKALDSLDPAKGTISAISDISFQKQAEEALRKSEERLELALNGADLGLWDYDLKTGEAIINERRAEMVGYSVDELGPHISSWGKLVHPDDIDRVTNAFNAHVRGRTPLYESEHRLRHKLGHYIWILARAKVVEWDEQGYPVRLVGTSLDITDRKRAEEELQTARNQLERRVEERTAELKESEEKYRLIFERSPIGIFHFDEAGSITACNDNFVRQIGSSHEKLIGLNTIRDIRDKKMIAAIHEALSGGMGHYEDNYSSVTAAKTTPVKCEFAPILSHDGRVAGGIGIIEDITDRKKAEESLRQSQQVLSLALEGANLGTWDWDLTTGKAAWSERIYSMLGYTPNEFEPNLKNWKRLVHPDDWPKVSQTLNLHLEGKLTNFEAIYRTPDKFGNWHWFQAQGTVTEFDADRKPIRMTGVVADITDRKKAEEALRDSEERYRALYEDNPSMYFTMDAQGTVLSVNRFGASELGYRVEELVGQPVLMVFHEDDREAVRQQFAACLQNPMQVAHWEFRKVRKDGSILWVKEVARSIRGADGNPLVLVVCEDITDRKEAEESLRVERERFQMLSDIAPFGMVMISKDGTFEYVNPKFTEIFGYDLSEVPNGRVWLRKAYPDPTYRHEVISAWIEALERLAPGETRSRIFTVTCKDGSKKTIHFRPVKSGMGADLMTCEDITDRMRAEEALRESESKYRLLVERAPVGILSVDREGRIEEVNPALVALLGSPSGEATRSINILTFPNLVEAGISAAFRECMEKNRAADVEFPYNSKWGKSSYFRLVLTPRLDAYGNVSGCQAIAEDISMRKQAEEALRESEEKYRTLFEDSIDAVYITTRAGFLVEANQAFLDLFGFSIEEARNMEIVQIYTDAPDRKRFQEEIEREGSLKDYELSFRKKDGTKIEGLLTATVRLGKDGTILGYQGIIRNVTEQKKLQGQLLQAQKMEAVGTLAGGIAHDFNNLLQAILGYTEILLMKKEPDDPDRKKLEVIQHAGRDGADLVSRILAFSKKSESKVRPIDLNQELRRIEKLLRRTLPQMIGINLVLSDELKTIDADPAQIEQVLLNLAVNAQHAMPDGGRLLIETSNVQLKDDYVRNHLEAKPGKYVLLTVSDTGMGMKPEVVDRIFEPFFTTKANGEGTGLGLAMVHGIVSQHGGYIRCYSEPGLGTSFKIYFPVSSTERLLDMAVTREMPAFGTETILLVDDDDRIREVAREMIKMGGYEVLAASSGEEALETYAAQRGEVSLVILDLIMPGMGGKRCLEELLRIDPHSRVLLASGYSSNGLTIDETGTGARGFIRKPYDAKDILRAIRKVLDRGHL